MIEIDTTLSSDDYKRLAQCVLRAQTGPVYTGPIQLDNGDRRTYLYNGRVQPKQRPQFKGGRAYTPKETRDFETSLKHWANENDMAIVTYPLRVTIHIMDKCESNDTIAHSALKLTYPTRGDLDNLSKGILDALNGIAYVDDKQVVELHLSRSWSVSDGFNMVMSRAGLSKFEYQNLLKYIKRAR